MNLRSMLLCAALCVAACASVPGSFGVSSAQAPKFFGIVARVAPEYGFAPPPLAPVGTTSMIFLHNQAGDTIQYVVNKDDIVFNVTIAGPDYSKPYKKTPEQQKQEDEQRTKDLTSIAIKLGRHAGGLR
jgi:hypothetical protein